MKVWVQKWGYDQELEFMSEDGKINVSLVFDVRNGVFIVRKNSWHQGSSELFIADNMVGFRE